MHLTELIEHFFIVALKRFGGAKMLEMKKYTCFSYLKNWNELNNNSWKCVKIL